MTLKLSKHIVVSQENFNKLKIRAKYGQSFDDIITEVLKSLEY